MQGASGSFSLVETLDLALDMVPSEEWVPVLDKQVVVQFQSVGLLQQR